MGTDGNIWYYYNDHDPYTTNATGGNWNKTPLNYNTPIQGAIALEDAQFGRLFYVGANAKLYQVNWTDADFPAICSVNTATHSSYNYDALDVPGTDTANQQTVNKTGINQASVAVYPNPSDNTFTITLGNLNNEAQVQLNISDISARLVYQTQVSVPNGGNIYQLIWNADNVSNGIYFYNININGKNFTGKMVKL